MYSLVITFSGLTRWIIVIVTFAIFSFLLTPLPFHSISTSQLVVGRLQCRYGTQLKGGLRIR